MSDDTPVTYTLPPVWHCRQAPNGQNPVVVCEREDLLAKVAALTAERDRLREALRSVIDMDEHGMWHGGVMSQARAALADPEPPCPRCEGSGQVTMHPNALHHYAIRDVYGEPWGDRETGPCPNCTGDET